MPLQRQDLTFDVDLSFALLRNFSADQAQNIKSQ